VNEEQTSFAAEPNIAVLSSVGKDNRPHATPVWYLFDDGEFRISIGAGGQKHRNVERNPEVTLVIDRREMPIYALMISGTAEIEPAFPHEDRLRLAVRYLGEDIGRRYTEMTAAEEVVSLRLRPRKVITFDSRQRVSG
jgi:PPOX class probable F420-dependent enzyme